MAHLLAVVGLVVAAVLAGSTVLGIAVGKFIKSRTGGDRDA